MNGFSEQNRRPEDDYAQIQRRPANQNSQPSLATPLSQHSSNDQSLLIQVPPPKPDRLYRDDYEYQSGQPAHEDPNAYRLAVIFHFWLSSNFLFLHIQDLSFVFISVAVTIHCCCDQLWVSSCHVFSIVYYQLAYVFSCFMCVTGCSQLLCASLVEVVLFLLYGTLL